MPLPPPSGSRWPVHGCQMAIAIFSDRYVFGPSGFWAMAPLCYAAKLDPILSLDCVPTPSTLAQSKKRKGSNFATWQPCLQVRPAARARPGTRGATGNRASRGCPGWTGCRGGRGRGGSAAPTGRRVRQEKRYEYKINASISYTRRGY